MLLHLSKTGVGLVQSAGAGVSGTTGVPFSLESMPTAGWSVLGGVHGQSEGSDIRDSDCSGIVLTAVFLAQTCFQTEMWSIDMRAPSCRPRCGS